MLMQARITQSVVQVVPENTCFVAAPAARWQMCASHSVWGLDCTACCVCFQLPPICVRTRWHHLLGKRPMSLLSAKSTPGKFQQMKLVALSYFKTHAVSLWS